MPSGDNWPDDGRCHTEHPVYPFHSEWRRVILKSYMIGASGVGRQILGKESRSGKNRMDQMLETDFDRIAGFNRTDRDFPDQVTLLELIEAQIGQHPLQPAVLCDQDR